MMEQELEIYALPLEDTDKSDSMFHEAYALTFCAAGEVISVLTGNEYILGASIMGSLTVAGVVSVKLIRNKE